MTQPARTTFDDHLYVSGSAAEHVGFLNCEAISERQHIHHWNVTPHHHEGLSQLFYFVDARVTTQLDDVHTVLEGPTLVWAPALSVHGFQYPPDIAGWVVTVATADLSRIVRAAPWLASWIDSPRYLAGCHHADVFRTADFIVREMVEEHRSWNADRNFVLQSHFQVLLAHFSRGLDREEEHTSPSVRRPMSLIREFRRLVDARFCETHSVSDYADVLAVTPTHLSRTVKTITGSTALEIIQERILLEAKRDLLFSERAINQIGYSLGFSTPSYFSRFFRRRTGITPVEFRRIGAVVPTSTTTKELRDFGVPRNADICRHNY
ncbi:helix-turn-helix domain-containing protein [Nitratireductor luteus]|uniref:helix-turn-helix domain-containing protein n=1 Tax=Nitratireductor luteus TaxID=2976980 RepID=UPI0022402A09|nr:helix-turn-helix domain-containing protein [Nitratireductor luteus]